MLGFVRTVLVLSICAVVSIGFARAADIPRIEWGRFIVESDTSGKPKSWASVSGPDGLTMSFLFDSLVAHADGKLDEAAAN